MPVCSAACTMCTSHVHEWYPLCPCLVSVSVHCTNMCLYTAPMTAGAWRPHSLGGQQHALAAVQFPRVSMLAAQVLGSCLGWELGLTDVAKVSGEVYGLS